eukprot:TRINITY_DN32387_c0_g1_i1.p1 TRINITY_DN32387_c0_g1~~TRINITY_DN32387_c0_g1_i1.p1  ORF type:complete len:336 (-),score=54.94 TRINITY_DN32387_c0_g1_i1:709-1716(-)
MAVMDPNGSQGTPAISEQEAAVYDRQIRIWGTAAQTRMGQASLLVVGITGAVAETCKNVVLAGIGSVTLMDDSPVSPAKAEANFLISLSEAGGVDDGGRTMAECCAPCLQELNPLVKVAVERGSLDKLSGDFLQRFDAVLLGGRPSLQQTKWLNGECRKRKRREDEATIGFFTVDCRGGLGRIFVDCGDRHTYAVKGKDGVLVEEHMSLEDALRIPWKSYPRGAPAELFAFQAVEEWEARKSQSGGDNDGMASLLAFRNEITKKQGLPSDKIPDVLLQRIFEAGTEELPPAAAILGGLLGQEVLRFVSGVGRPVGNFLTLDSALPASRVLRLKRS